MKPLPRCKERLIPVLKPRERAGLVLWMIERVAKAALAATSISEVVVLGGDEPVQELCRLMGVAWTPDTALDLNAALDGFYLATCKGGWQAMLYLAGDLPLIDAATIGGIVEGLDSTDLVLATGARGGTNAILCRCDVAFRFQLGEASYQLHEDQAHRIGVAPRRYESSRTIADLDTPEDLQRLLNAEPDLWQQTGRLERLLPRVAM